MSVIRLRVSEVVGGAEFHRSEYLLPEDAWGIIEYMILNVLPKLREVVPRPVECDRLGVRVAPASGAIATVIATAVADAMSVLTSLVISIHLAEPKRLLHWLADAVPTQVSARQIIMLDGEIQLPVMMQS